MLCIDGSRRPIDEFQVCNWGVVPSRAIVTSSATNQSTRKLYQRFLEKAAHRFFKDNTTSTTEPNNQWNVQENNYDNRTDFENRFNYDSSNPSGFDNNFNNYNNRNNNYDNRDGFDRNYNGGGSGFNDWDNSRNDDRNNSYFNREGLSTDYPSIQPIENFNLFESAPKYSTQHNLMFSVRAYYYLVIHIALK